MTMSTKTERRGFVHSALLYHSQREYLDVVGRFVSDGVALGEPVLVAVPADWLASLRTELGARGTATAELQMIDIARVAHNPGRFLAVASSFAAKYADRRVRIVSQLVWPGRTADECVACMQHEALVNRALAPHSVMGLCLYDAERLDDELLADARATHPLLWKCGSAYHNADYAPETTLVRCNQPLPPNPGAVTYLVRDSTDLRPARSFAVDYAEWVGLAQDSLEDLRLITTELATNSLQYADGECQLAFWRHDEHLVCEARDSGRFDQPLVGRQLPSTCATASRGLFLVNAMADLVRTYTTANGTTIQAYLRLKPSAASGC
ncbi:sensor histidine kinase [Mycobacterium gastri]|uniref:Regulator of Sig8 n=1 Tax=Mycobacterium gastri TaxID=1777 RepID=A0A1X1VCW4_MYCGS|nr:sensor histidine kinase [Mycobacterium gastri]ETW25568.1 regulator of Sig8 [Mycobacterium gastri 'Wayne']ORV66788.1 regulator of Sig8 [Mycobacterium gastri]